MTATVRTQCIRCLEDFDQPIAVEFADEYRPTIDILTGSEIDARDADTEDEHFPISDIHIVDFARRASRHTTPLTKIPRNDEHTR